MPKMILAQEQEYQTLKSDKHESFAFPFSASNHSKDKPLVYTFDKPKGPSWILTIWNNMSYIPAIDSKTVIRIQEPQPSEKYIELAMFGGETKRYWVAVNTKEDGYARIYDQDNGWTTEGPLAVTHAENGGLTVTNGKRTVVDRLDLGGFIVGSIVVYGNEDEKTTANTYAGNISFEIVFGNFAQSSLYYVPFGIMIGIGTLVLVLLLFKKRKSD